MNNKGITLVALILIIGLLIILTATIIRHIVLSIDWKEINTIESQNIQVEKECNHDWVTTSKYDFIYGCFKTISKCSKCGKEI